MSAADSNAVERSLRGWSMATGGWAGMHAGLAVVALLMGAEVGVDTTVSRALAVLVVASWTTAAAASWAFRRSFRTRAGLLAAGASLVAGAVLPVVAAPGIWPILDGFAHALAGIGFAAALWRARAFFRDDEAPSQTPD